MAQATSPKPRRGCHLGSQAYTPCHQSKGSNPDESEADTWASEGLKGPKAGKMPQNQVDTGPAIGPT
jgi:hypothetical protein